MNMYWHELKAYRKSTIIWILSVTALIVLFLSFYPSFSQDTEEFKKLLENYPQEIIKAFGISIDSFFSILGLFSYIYTYVVLCSSIQAMNLGTSILSKEVREKTADFLLAKPVSRTQIVTAKLFAALTAFIFSNIIYIVAASMMAFVVVEGSFNYKAYFLIALTSFLVGMMFLVLGILVSVVLPKIKSVLPISLSTVFGFFILSLFSSVIDGEVIRYFIPFKYFDTAYIMEHSSYETIFLVIEIVFIILAVVASYIIYLKKDINAV
jgi:ABC-2 type transport system permease protein